MLLNHIGEEQATADVQQAVKKVLAVGKIRTKDMGGSYKTPEVGYAVVREFLAL